MDFNKRSTVKRLVAGVVSSRLILVASPQQLVNYRDTRAVNSLKSVSQKVVFAEDRANSHRRPLSESRFCLIVWIVGKTRCTLFVPT